MKLAAILITLVLSVHHSTASDNKMVALDFSQVTSESVKIDNQSEINLTQGFTICLRVKSKYLSNSDLVHNIGTVYIYIGNYTLPSIYAEIGGKSFFIPWPSNKIKLVPLVWYSLCLAYVTTENNVVLTVNKEVAMNFTFKTDLVSFELQPTFTIGGRRDYQFYGLITDLNIWNQPLSLSELIHYAECNTADLLGLDKDLAIRWSKVVQFGKLRTLQVDYMEICSNEEPTPWLELVHILQTFKESVNLCSSLGGSLLYPKAVEDLSKINDVMAHSKYADTCNSDIWIPIKRSKDDQFTWIRYGTNEVAFLPWTKGQPNGMGLQDCIIGDHKGYYDTDCHDQHCSYCQTQRYHFLNLRGSCFKDSRIDSKYVLFKNENEEFIFQGFSGKSFIIAGSDNNIWNLVVGDQLNQTVIGTMESSSNFPIGIRNWTIREGYCGQSGNTSRVTIKISKVNIRICFRQILRLSV